VKSMTSTRNVTATGGRRECRFVVMICDVICGVPENSTKDLAVVAAMRRRQLQDIVNEAQCSLPVKRRRYFML
jgi:hypothetical protein